MAKVKMFITHKGQAKFICEFNAGFTILNDGVVHMRIPKKCSKCFFGDVE